VRAGTRATFERVPPLYVSSQDSGNVIVFVAMFQEDGAMAGTERKEEYTYQVNKIRFIVTPVYKEKGELLRDILLKLMLADLPPA